MIKHVMNATEKRIKQGAEVQRRILRSEKANVIKTKKENT